MHYKTIVLELLTERHLKVSLETLDKYATELRNNHTSTTHRFRKTWPHLSHEQTASEAMELAIEDLKASLPDSINDPAADHSQTA